MYSTKAKRARPNGLTNNDQHSCHQASAQRACGVSRSTKHQQTIKGSIGKSSPFAHPRKKQRTHATEGGDVKLSPLQKQHLKVGRQLDTDGRTVLEWSITDSTIDDTRHFQNLTHAQAFIDECWAFIFTDLRRGTVSSGSPDHTSVRQRTQPESGRSKSPGSQQQNRLSKDSSILHAEAPKRDQGVQQLSEQTLPAQGRHRSSHLAEAAATTHEVGATADEFGAGAQEAVATAGDAGATANLQPFGSDGHHSQQDQPSSAGRQTFTDQASFSRERTPSATHEPAQAAPPAASAATSISGDRSPSVHHTAAAARPSPDTAAPAASSAAAKAASITASISRDRSPPVPHTAAAARPSSDTAAPAAAKAASVTASFSQDRSPSVPNVAAPTGPCTQTPAPATSPAAASAVPRWPCNSKRMANVTELHGGTVKPGKRSKHQAGAALHGPASASASWSLAGRTHPWRPAALREQQSHQQHNSDQLSSSPHPILAPAQPDQTCNYLPIRSGRSTSSSPGSPLVNPSQPQVKLESADLDIPSSSTTANHQLRSEPACQHEPQLHYGPAQPSQQACQHQPQLLCGSAKQLLPPDGVGSQRHSPLRKRLRPLVTEPGVQHSSSQVDALLAKSRPNRSSVSPAGPGGKLSGQHWQLNKAHGAQFKCSPSSTAQHAGPSTARSIQPGLSLSKKERRDGSSTQREGSVLSACAKLSWGQRKPRTRLQPRQSDDSTAELATVAATAAAEAEQAATAAAATVCTSFEESASQSQTQEQPAAKRPCRKQSSFHSLSTPQGHSVRTSPVAECVLPSQRREHANFSAREHTRPKQGGFKSGRQHFRAGALPSNLNKSLGYIGSTYLGVNGVKHGPERTLRWRAGTWDPVIKKTVYIGSYDTELGAATAVDAWHMSQGREAVNFPPQSGLAPDLQPGPQTQLKQQGLPEQAETPIVTSHLHQAAALLSCLRPQQSEQVALAQKPTVLQVSSPVASHGCAKQAGSKSQRQFAAGALVANAAGRSRTSRDGMGKARQFSRERLAASLCGKQKW